MENSTFAIKMVGQSMEPNFGEQLFVSRERVRNKLSVVFYS